ncbi:MAG TPA: guanylate kinase, partial [Candidatus Cybelea sp.]
MTTGPGLLFVVSGPSGAGKDTLVEGLRANRPSLRYSVSATTREARPEERDGEHYFFVSSSDFEGLRRDGGLL